MKELAAEPHQAFSDKGVMKPEQAEIERLRKEAAKMTCFEIPEQVTGAIAPPASYNPAPLNR